MANTRIFSAAVDCIARFRVGTYPLKNVAQDVIKARKLNSRERKVFLDVVFRFSREIHLIHRFIATHIPFANSMSAQQKDMLALNILCHDDERDSQIASMVESYEAWHHQQGSELWLKALSPLLEKHLRADFGDDALEIARGLFERPTKYIAYDRRHVTLTQVLDALEEQQTPYFLHPSLSHAVGIRGAMDSGKLEKQFGEHVWFMDAASQIVSELIKPKPHERVLEMCTGVGNKAKYITTHDCHYVALDINEQRLKKAKQRLRDRHVQFLCVDGRNASLKENSFDWILLDAPCSGTGVLRRNPDLMLRLTQADLDKYTKLQWQLLNSAVKLLRPSGILIYVTCSLIRAENDQQIARLLQENSQVNPVPLRGLLSADLKLQNQDLDNNWLYLYPHMEDCDGFFCAALSKKPIE